MRLMTFARLAVACSLVLLALSACASNEPDGSRWTPSQVPAKLEHARQLAANGETESSLQLLRGLRLVRGLNPDLRDEVEITTEAVARQRLSELADGKRPEELDQLVDMELPRQLTVSAAIEKARRLLKNKEDKQVFQTIQDLDRRHPYHHQGKEAAEILYAAGDRMARDSDSFFGFMTLRDNGLEALEYLCDHFVSAPNWDQACVRIAELYEQNEDWVTARQWYEDLLFLRPESPMRVRAQAEIPKLRLASIQSPEYDRNQLLEARRELEFWLGRNPEHELTPRVRRDLRDCLQRLWASDLVAGRFYERNEKLAGARLHGERALATARELGAEKLEKESRSFLKSLAKLEGKKKQKPQSAENAEELLDELIPGDFANPDLIGASPPRQGKQP